MLVSCIATVIVVIQRTELIIFYNRHGYTDTGQRLPFHSTQFAHPKRNDLEFCIMPKCVKINFNFNSFSFHVTILRISKILSS
jgi:hypothetical protein